jgi:hypothetical protein
LNLHPPDRARVASRAVSWVTSAIVAVVAGQLAGCAGAPAPDPAGTLLAALAGTWSNQRQFDAAPAALKVKPSVDGEWLDHQHAVFAAVDAPAFGPRVLYLEWRSGGPAGPLSRQRLWVFRTDADGALRMDFHALGDGAPWVGKATEPGAFRALAAQALRSYAPDCALRFARTPAGGWRGEVTAAQCSLTAASGRRMGIDAVVELTPEGQLLYRESGVLPDGRYAFRVPPGQAYRFERLR